MSLKINLTILYSYLFSIVSIGLLSSCVSSLYIGSVPSAPKGDQVTHPSYTGQPYATATRASYLIFQEASTQTIYDHRKGFSANQQRYQSDLSSEIHQNPKAIKRINRLEKKVNKRAKQHLKADLKELRAQAKLERARRKAGIQTTPFFPYHHRHTHDHNCYHRNR